MLCYPELRASPGAPRPPPQPCTRKREMPLVPEKGTVWEKLRRWGVRVRREAVVYQEGTRSRETQRLTEGAGRGIA